MAATREKVCPGCGLALPVVDGAVYDGYYHTTPECWAVYTEVLGAEFGNAVLFGQSYQLTVDAYALQHAGGRHPDKSIDVHLVGLHLVLERVRKPPVVAPLLTRLASAVGSWPHFPPSALQSDLTVFDVALAESPLQHAARSRAWAESVWRTWSEHHEAVAAFAECYLDLEPLDAPR